ncbi:hypothetical protein T4C_4026 [Trichinella pseudospiralis]|uniref:Uncharacterized protein n=1 Tax=Trichinella pseudospiralis TaxID=6337 RepID=A0A0V1JFF4_TRIPS|nr:hypothetical protein T4C_4026 [Trichinella pseudospiralis]
MSLNRLDQRGVLGPSLSSLPSVSSIFRDDRLWFVCQASVSGHQNFLKYHPLLYLIGLLKTSQCKICIHI